MNMKKIYQIPEAMLCVLSVEDVIATSSLNEHAGDPTWGEDKVSWDKDFKI